MTVDIREHTPGKDVKEFIAFPHTLYAHDPAWIAPLNMEVTERLNPKKNPFFEHADIALFSAWRDGKMVGRASAQIDREHLRIHNDATGFFGFFDTIDDQEVARSLLLRAEDWLRARGMKQIRGPFSLSINEEVGVLIEGFEHPPVIMMTHSLPYQGGLIEASGYRAAKDLLSWRYVVEDPPERAKRALQAMADLPEVSFRSLDKKNMKRDVGYMLEIFNDAWKENWGFVPATPAEADKMAKDLAMILDPELAFFAEIDGKPVALCVAAPNLNEVVRDFGGRLSPVNIVKLLWRLKVDKPKSARLIMLGIRQELRHVRKYAPLSTALYAEVARRGKGMGLEWAELSWTLEDNHSINLGIKAMRAKVYKKYRVYEKSLA